MAKLSHQAEKHGWKLLGKNLGRGGQGDVDLVERLAEPGGTKYAFKSLGERGGARARERFSKELEVLRKVNHPGIVKVVDFAQADDDFQYYVMEYVEGAESLRRRMDHETNPFYRNPLKTIDGFIQIVEALGACEEARVVHRDLSPANVLVTNDSKVMLIDFGLCQVEDGHRLTLTEEAVGTPHYRPPECSGYSSEQVTIRADFYSAGKILWSMVTSKVAFDREQRVFNDLSLAKVLPEDKMAWHLQHIFERTIRKEPSNRYGYAAQALAGAKTVRRLIEERYLPLEALAEGTCYRCGVGRFEDLPTTVCKDDVNRFLTALGEARQVCLICPYCFHVTFVVDAAQKQRLAARKALE